MISRATLDERVWGYDSEESSNWVEVTIRRLRKKIEADPDDPTFIQTIRGLGYRFRAVA